MSTKNERREPHMTSSDTTSPILITGATGRHGGTGAHLARRLREAGRSVRALVRRLDERTAPLQALGTEIVVGDHRSELTMAILSITIVILISDLSKPLTLRTSNFLS